MNTQASRFVGSVPENYDTGLGPHLFIPYAEDLADRVAGMHPGSVLELAAGTGIVSRRLRDRLDPACRLIVSDLNPPMLDIARTKFADGENVSFQALDAQELPFEDASLDVVACQFGVMFFPDRDKAYRDGHRVLKSGGRYILNVWDSLAANPFSAGVQRLIERLFPENPPGFYKVPFGYHDADKISADLAGAGFTDVKIDRVAKLSRIISPELFSTGLVFGNPFAEEILARGGDPEAVRVEIEEMIRAELDGTLSLNALVAVGRKP